MHKHITIAVTMLGFSGAAFADEGVVNDFFQTSYAANLNIGDSYLNFTNSGATVVNGVSQIFALTCTPSIHRKN